MSRRFTPPKLAKFWGISPDKITALIKAGQLDAIDLASPGSKRPRYSISEESIVAFEARRAVITPTSKSQRRRAVLSVVKRYV
jgi:hypothetical protein